MPLRVLELFAGIGGDALALKAAGFRVAGYCEILPWNRAVLESNMARGRLDYAPIYPDVRELARAHIRGRVDMIAGGFPCQGLSKMGKRAGLYGDHRSSLVRHIYRLVDELDPTYVFLENTANILRDRNYGDLLRQIAGRGYRVAFVVHAASQAGAAHQRARWFLLAQKEGARGLRIPRAALGRLTSLFSKRPRSNLVLHNSTMARHTCHAFGNAVVPAQALSALRLLAAALEEDGGVLREVRLPLVHRFIPTLLRNGRLWQPRDAEDDPAARECRGPGFTVHPPRDRGRHRARRTSPVLTEPIKVDCIPTARTQVNCCTPGRTMTKRSRHDPANMLLSAEEMYRDRHVPPDSVRRKLAVSPEFWAVNFGYPRDWISGPLAQACNARGRPIRSWP